MDNQKASPLRESFQKAVLTSQARQLLNYEKGALSKRIEILNVGIDNLAVDEFLNNLNRGVVFTPNVDHLMRLREDQEFVKAYDVADYRVCDSQILMYASKFLGTPIKAKISGSDLFPMFCEHHRHNPKIKIFLLGGAEGVPQRAQKHINQRIGREIVVEAHSPTFGFEKDEAECQRIIEMIRNSSANVLIVGVGAPKQEKWIAKYQHQLPNIDIFMGVGAAIDFEAGNKLRSPRWMSEVGLEWLYRLLSEPKRLWKRYLFQDLPFLWLLLKEKLKYTFQQPVNSSLKAR
ncbi:WecB/TagA/CpsF family glycosyltransferase [Leptolyngbya iicbica]|uniref:Glycosyltransferase n=2 Tax=Cyanophyceae TaxID=3028117 RepID=A0A4Q7EHN7_9CYAN|nr:WecB/TagA/CpsF family glycosyltransferase [Leptolyngbya sp. LK]RZM82637.1 glycosyltransferase [Leptolyngbya sp. LK]